jgi:hypothetical protein
MRLILWLFILIMILFSLVYTNTEALDSCNTINGGVKMYRIKHGSTPKLSTTSATIRCNYKQFPPSTKLKDCVRSAATNISTKLMTWDPSSDPADDSLTTKYYMASPEILSDVNTCNWLLFKNRVGVVDPVENDLDIDTETS